MPEPLTLELVVGVLRDLHAAFPSRLDEQTIVRRAELYRNNLNGFSGDAVRWAAKTAVQEDSFFPKVARLRDLAKRWQISNPTAFTTSANDRRCKCGANYEWLDRWRPLRRDSGWGSLVLSADREWLMLEKYSRSLCPRCDEQPPYFPEIDAPSKEPAMRLRQGDRSNVPQPILLELAGPQPRNRNHPAPLAPKVPGRAA